MKVPEFTNLLLSNCKDANPIQNKADYTRASRWKNKTSSTYLTFSIIAAVIGLVIVVTSSSSIGLPQPVAFVAIPFVSIFFAWGLATMILNFKLLVKSVFYASAQGYRIGEQIQTTHVTITHTNYNQYKVSSYTEDEGIALALINGFINLFLFTALCVYVCPFLTFGKIKRTKQNLLRFQSSQMSR